MDWTEGAVLAAAAVAAGAVNSVAGGGTLISFPALVHGAGLDLRVANATSTVALWPGWVGAIGGYRQDLVGARGLMLRLAVPSLLGGGFGAFLLLYTGERTFQLIVPWLVLLATALFAASERIADRFRAAEGGGDPRPGPGAMLYQFGVATYGGYFGAGAGILILAALGTLGMRDVHRMNGVKTVLGLLLNAVAVLVFVVAAESIVAWPQALLMMAAALLGGFAGAKMAKRVPKGAVRGFVVVCGLAVAGVEFWRAYGR